MKIFSFAFLPCYFGFLISAQAQAINGVAYTPDEYLLSQGQKWHYHTAIADKPKKLNLREPNNDEKDIAEKAQRLLTTTSAKSIALVMEVMWFGLGINHPQIARVTF